MRWGHVLRSRLPTTRRVDCRGVNYLLTTESEALLPVTRSRQKGQESTTRCRESQTLPILVSLPTRALRLGHRNLFIHFPFLLHFKVIVNKEIIIRFCLVENSTRPQTRGSKAEEPRDSGKVTVKFTRPTQQAGHRAGRNSSQEPGISQAGTSCDRSLLFHSWISQGD